MSFEGKRSLPKLFIIASIAIIAIFVASMYKDIAFIREPVTEDVIVTGKADSDCIVDTSDSIMSSKTIKNCELQAGEKITISYKKGLPTAVVAEP